MAALDGSWKPAIIVGLVAFFALKQGWNTRTQKLSLWHVLRISLQHKMFQVNLENFSKIFDNVGVQSLTPRAFVISTCRHYGSWARANGVIFSRFSLERRQTRRERGAPDMCNVGKQRTLLSAASPVTRLARLASFALAFSLMKNVKK